MFIYVTDNFGFIKIKDTLNVHCFEPQTVIACQRFLSSRLLQFCRTVVLSFTTEMKIHQKMLKTFIRPVLLGVSHLMFKLSLMKFWKLTIALISLFKNSTATSFALDYCTVPQMIPNRK